MGYKYKDVLNAENETWQAEATTLLDKGIQFAVANIPIQRIRDCIALAQEYDFTCLVEDKEITNDNFPQVQPKILGFVHRNISKRISN
jgi:hypothetical protein